MPTIDTAATRDQLIAAGAAQLAAAGVAAPRRQMLNLIAGLERTSVAEQRQNCDTPASDGLRARWYNAVARLAAGEPLAYVTEWTGFRHLELRCDPRALIPRPETEGLVELALSRACTGTAADIGTGSGCIALSLATEGQFDAVFALDRSTEALDLARDNGAATGVQVTWLEGDLVAPLPSGAISMLVANPPYLTVADYDRLDPSVRDHEPMAALVSGPDGMDHTRRLLDEGRRVMCGGGWAVIELDSRRANAAAAIAQSCGWRDVEVHLDLFERPRYLVARHGSVND